MMTRNKHDTITKDEIVRMMSKKTGFTIGNCKIAYDAVVEVLAEVIEDGRSIVFQKFGRLEPHTKKPRKYYKLDKDTKFKLDDAGRPETYIFPAVRTVRFHMSERYKYRLNPGVYCNEVLFMEDSD